MCFEADCRLHVLISPVTLARFNYRRAFLQPPPPSFLIAAAWCGGSESESVGQGPQGGFDRWVLLDAVEKHK